MQADLTKKIEVLEGKLTTISDQITEIYFKSQNDVVIELQKLYLGDDFSWAYLGGGEGEKEKEDGVKG